MTRGISLPPLSTGAARVMAWIGELPDSTTLFRPEPSLLAQVVGGLAVGMYFAEGIRPNLIYRHRFYRHEERMDV